MLISYQEMCGTMRGIPLPGRIRVQPSRDAGGEVFYVAST
jgi:hypothetical protein